MEIKNIKKLIPVAHKLRMPLFFWGKQGVGKSELLEATCKSLGLGFVRLNLAAQEVGDIVGLLDKTENGFVRHLMPEWFPTEGKGIIYLDEFNRAHPDVIQAIFPLLTEFQFHTHLLPEGWAVFAAGNHASNEFNVTDTSDAALLSRFCHVDFHPTVEEFVFFAESKGSDGADMVADFARAHPEMLETNSGKAYDVFEKVTPDRRSFLRYIAKLEEEKAIEDFRFEVYQGIIGKSAAASFIAYKNKAEKRITSKDILRRYDKVRDQVFALFKDTKDVRFDSLNGTVEEIFLYLEGNTLPDKEIDCLKQFILDIPMEMCMKMAQKMEKLNWAQKNLILNNKEFVEKFKQIKSTSVSKTKK